MLNKLNLKENNILFDKNKKCQFKYTNNIVYLNDWYSVKSVIIGMTI